LREPTCSVPVEGQREGGGRIIAPSGHNKKSDSAWKGENALEQTVARLSVGAMRQTFDEFVVTGPLAPFTCTSIKRGVSAVCGNVSSASSSPSTWRVTLELSSKRSISSTQTRSWKSNFCGATIAIDIGVTSSDH
jgi:hypothetical protein